jgi:small multidrug resistance pump
MRTATSNKCLSFEGVAMHWVYLAVAILFEISGTTCMKLSQGFGRPWAAALMVLFYVISFSSLTLALKTMDLSIAYAIWAGVGTAVIAAIGIIWFKEPLTTLKLVSLTLVIVGIVGLNLAGGGHGE